ncbi:MAG: ribonuclease P protein component [Robiginitomaculum sp.]
MTKKHQKLGRLRKRAEFLFVANRQYGRYQARPTVIVQIRPNLLREDGVNVGFTATKRIGNAVIRNRAKRRLRACAQELLPANGKPGHDYVFIARETTPSADWPDLIKDVEKALLRLA